MNNGLTVATLIFVSAISPGPNNLLVLNESATQGVRAALAITAGIVAGGIVMLCMARIGLSAAIAELPRMHHAVVVLGSAYLAFLGVKLFWNTNRASTANVGDADVRTAFGMFGFQFFNPKAWVLAITSVGIWRSPNDAAQTPFLLLLVMFAVISCCSLLLWIVFGHWLRDVVTSPRARVLFDRCLGGLLVASAGLFLMKQI